MLMSTPVSSWPLSANWAASGRPILPRPMTAIFMGWWHSAFVEIDGATFAGRKNACIGDSHSGETFAHGHDVMGSAKHGVTEVFVLHPERLRLGDCKAGAVTFADAAERLHLVPFGRHDAVLMERQVAGQCVSHVGALFAGHHSDALFERREPVDEVACNSAVLHLGGDRDQILVFA